MICRFQQAVSLLMTFEYLLRFPDIIKFWSGLEDVFISLNPVELLITVCFSSLFIFDFVEVLYWSSDNIFHYISSDRAMRYTFSERLN